jgi:pyruvate dehydrogenase (quinone)
VKKPGELEEALGAALGHARSALLSVQVAKQELLMPPTVNFEQAKGFGVYLVKAMLNHRGMKF